LHLKAGARLDQHDSDIAWLRSLPKADLHCHLGGCQHPAVLKELAAKLIYELNISKKTCHTIIDSLEKQLGVSEIAMITPERLRSLGSSTRNVVGNIPERVHCLQYLPWLFATVDQPRHVCTAVLVNSLSKDRLLELSRDGRLSDDGRAISCPIAMMIPCNGTWPAVISAVPHFSRRKALSVLLLKAF